jgi:formylglycine-generating enzyme required for sulfatase activity
MRVSRRCWSRCASQGDPADAEVFVNGESRGKAPASLSLPASRHHVEVRKEGYNPFVAELALAPGIARTVDFKLVNPKDIAGNSPQKITTKSGIKLLIVPGGTYQAGSDRREQGRRPNEGAHKVTLLRPFYMGEREVTNAQFRLFRANHNSGSAGVYSLDLDKQPVSRVTWEEAAEFCNWLSAQEGLPPAYQARDGGSFVLTQPVTNGFRLPTEAEWEYVARAASTGKPLKYPWGAELPVVSGTANIGGAEAAELLGAVVDGHRDEFPAASGAGAVPAQSARLLRHGWQRVGVGQRSLPLLCAIGGRDRSGRAGGWQEPRDPWDPTGARRPPSSCAFRGAMARSSRATSSASASRATWRRSRRASCVTHSVRSSR